MLSDQQVAIIMDAASKVPDRWRGRYLDAVADRLLCCKVIDDDDVLDAVRTTAARFYVRV